MGDLSQGFDANLAECVGAVKPKSGPMSKRPKSGTTSSLDQSEYVEASTHYGGYQDLAGQFVLHFLLKDGER